MIRVVLGKERHKYPQHIDTMFRQRKRLFHDRLGWDVAISDGWEIDQYDESNPIYLISVDEETGDVVGSLRLMPTTGPNMLRDIFMNAFEDEILIESALVWECTRFCVDPDANNLRKAENRLAYATCELLLGICEIGLLAGVAQIVGVFDKRMVKIYKRAAWSPEIIGSSQDPAFEKIHVGLWDISEEVLADMKASSGIQGSVLEGHMPQALRLTSAT